MAKSWKSKVKAWLHRDAERPGQADPSEPHWIVMCLSVQKAALGQLCRPRMHFRHPTEEGAAREAMRLAGLRPGWRYGVFGSGESFKASATGAEP